MFGFFSIRQAFDVWLVLQISFPFSLICCVRRLTVFLPQSYSHRGLFYFLPYFSLLAGGMKNEASVWAPLFILSGKKSIEMMRMIAKSWVKTAHWKPKCHHVERKNYLPALKIHLILSAGKVESVLSADNSSGWDEGGSHVVLTRRRSEHSERRNWSRSHRLAAPIYKPRSVRNNDIEVWYCVSVWERGQMADSEGGKQKYRKTERERGTEGNRDASIKHPTGLQNRITCNVYCIISYTTYQETLLDIQNKVSCPILLIQICVASWTIYREVHRIVPAIHWSSIDLNPYKQMNCFITSSLALD